MKCDDVNRLILLATFLVAIGDVIAFFTELLSQRCDRKEASDSEKAEQALIARIDELERRIKELEKA